MKLKDTFSRGEVASACCVWEEMIERHRWLDGPKDTVFDQVWENFGSCAMRDVAVVLGLRFDEAWEIMQNYESEETSLWDLPFDWEFVPRMLNFVKWEEIDFYHDCDDSIPDARDFVARYLLRYAFGDGR